jgi:hypothetical protein
MSSPWWSVLSFCLLVPGFGFFVATRLRVPAAERLLVTAVGGVVLLALAAQGLHILHSALMAWRLLAIVAAVGWLLHWREAGQWWRHPVARAMLLNWALVAAGGLLALAAIRNYSGGDWIGDWAGHYHRAHFFLHQDPAELWIFQYDPFAARPPLLNLATAGVMAHSPDSFASYQIITSLLGTLVALPLSRLVVLAGGRARAVRALPLVTLLNPMLIQNATYSWTKLGTAVFVLTGAYFFRRATISGRRLHWHAAGLALMAGAMAHYSAVPYLIVAAVAFLLVYRSRWNDRAFWRQTAALALSAGALGVTWAAWALARAGLVQSFASNTTVSMAHDLSLSQQLRAFGLNLWRSVLPPPWPSVDWNVIQHGNAAATARDLFFAYYQTCLPGMIGLGGLTLLLWALTRPEFRRACGAISRLAWLLGITLVVLCVAVHPHEMHWGAGHICLQPIGLALLAIVIAVAPRAPRSLMPLVAFAYAIDLCGGIGLHLSLESISVPASVILFQDGAALRSLYGLAFANNAAARNALDLTFLGDSTPAFVVIAGSLLLLVILGWRLSRRHRSCSAPGNRPASCPT